MRIDVDGCRDYLEVFGRSATENMLRQVGRTIASAMRRTSDVVARLADDEFLLLGVSMPTTERPRSTPSTSPVASARWPSIHPRSRTGRYLTVSVGVVDRRAAARARAARCCSRRRSARSRRKAQAEQVRRQRGMDSGHGCG